MPDRTAVILLAAGGSVRMGACKQLLPFKGRSLLRHAADAALGTGCRVIVVLGDQAQFCRDALAGLDLSVVVNPFWQRGMGNSLRVGIDHALALDPEINAIVVHLCDQPLVTADALRALIDAHNRTGKPLVASEYDQTLGPPALISGPYFKELQCNTNDQVGAKSLLNSAPPEDLQKIPLPAAAHDMDNPKDYNALQHRESDG
jgi:CTP:molybdopterin cytidylyltransferase MocA